MSTEDLSQMEQDTIMELNGVDDDEWVPEKRAIAGKRAPKKKTPKKRPQRKRKMKEKEVTSHAPSISDQVSSLKRSQLELLVKHSLEDSSPITLTQVQDYLHANKTESSSKKQKTIKPAAIKFFQEGADDLFSRLPVPLFLDIMSLLPLRTRLTCATSVCKSWRALLLQDEVWETCNITVNKEKNVVKANYPTMPGLKRMFEGPLKGRVKRLYLNIWGKAAMAKYILSQTNHPGALYLQGKNLTKTSILQGLGKTGGLFTDKLVVFCIGASNNISDNQAVVLKIAENAPCLRRISIAAYCDVPFFEALASSCKKATATGDALLTHFSITKGDWFYDHGSLDLCALAKLGGLFPELKSCTAVRGELRSMIEDHIFGIGFQDRHFTPSSRLKKLVLENLPSVNPRVTQEIPELNNLLDTVVPWLLMECHTAFPALECLTVKIGQHHSWRKDNVMPVPINGALSGTHFPALRYLVLKKCVLTEADVESFSAPHLEYLELDQCGPMQSSKDVATAMLAKCEHLREHKLNDGQVVVTDESSITQEVTDEEPTYACNDGSVQGGSGTGTTSTRTVRTPVARIVVGPWVHKPQISMKTLVGDPFASILSKNTRWKMEW